MNPATSSNTYQYRPIKRYHTRLILLHGDNGVPSSSLVCTFQVADILDSKFGAGLGVHSASGENDMVQYEALSYAWGSNERTEVIICDGLRLPITRNLSEALYALRNSGDQVHYLWADAICINQSDDHEKSEQVDNMFMIFQRAAKVIAWLGTLDENLEDVVAAANVLADGVYNETVDFWSVHNRLKYIYSRDWWRRLWVQQEVFASRELELQCGSVRFKGSCLLTMPSLHSDLLDTGLRADAKRLEQLDGRSSKYSLSPAQALSDLNDLREQRLNYTGLLEATDPRDYIYGLLGITDIPAETIPVEEWMTGHPRKQSIPIDYSAPLNTILAAVTELLLKRFGLCILSKFKILAAVNDSGQCDQAMPSWVIDWRLAARLFVRNGESTPSDLLVDDSYPMKDNPDTEVLNEKLVVYGTSKMLNCYLKGQHVWAKRTGRYLEDRPLWKFSFEVYDTDILVGFYDRLGWMDEDSRLWLLRPAGDREYKILACLDWKERPSSREYYHRHWQWNPDHQDTRYRQLGTKMRSQPFKSDVAESWHPWDGRTKNSEYMNPESFTII